MKQLKKFLSGFLMVCLVAGLLPPLTASASTEITLPSGSSEDDFLSALNDIGNGGTIVISDTLSLEPADNTDNPFCITKDVTIKGGSINLRYGGIILAGNVTFEDMTLAFANNTQNAIMANGHKLTLKDVTKDNSTIWPIHLFAGGLVSNDYTSATSGSHGTIEIQGSVDLDGTSAKSQIYAGSYYNLNSGSATSDPTRANDVDIIFTEDARGSIDAVYACGAINNSGGTVYADSTACPVNGTVKFQLYNSTTTNIDGAANDAGNYASVTFRGSGNRAALSLSKLSSLTVESGYLQPKVLSFNGNNAAITVDASARLDLSELGDSIAINDFTGGGELVLGQSQTLNITGTISEETNVGIGSIFNGASTDIPLTEHTYINAPNSISDPASFTLIPPNSQDHLQFVRDNNGIWTVEGEAPSLLVKALEIEDQTISAGNDSTVIPLNPTYNNALYPGLYYIPLNITVNGVSAQLTDANSEDEYIYYHVETTANESSVAFDLEFNLDEEDNSESLLVSTPDNTAIPEGTYQFNITIPSSYTDGKNISTDFKLTVGVAEPTSHMVTVLQSQTSNSGAGSYSVGTTVYIDAGSQSDAAFTHWTSDSNDIIFDNPNNSSTFFTMPEHEVTVTANWQAVAPPDSDTYTVKISGSYADISGAGSYSAGDIVTINAGTRDGYTFTRWSGSDDVVFDNESSASTTFTMPAHDVTVTANWTQTVTPPDPDEKYAVTVNDSYAATSGAGSYSEGDTVTINAGTRDGYTFTRWSGSDDVVFDNESSASTTFTMPAHGVTVTANWTQTVTPSDPDAKYTVTVNGSHADISGAGSYSAGDIVTINAGTRDGYTFTSWSGSDSVAFADPLNAQTTFTMPAQDVTITANWVENTEPSPEVYTVTVNGSYADRSGAGNYPAGAEVVIDAGSRSGYSFTGWTSADVLQFLNAGNFRTSFTMPAASVSVTANWRRNSTGSSTGGSSSGGAGASGGSGSSSSRKDKDDDTSSSVKTLDQSLSESISAAPLGSTVNMTLTAGGAKVGKTVFSTLAGKNASLAIQTGSVTWKVNGLELSRTASYRDVDLGVSVNAGTIPQSALASLPGGSQIMQLALAQEGSYGMRLHLTVDTGIGSSGQWANFYAYSPLSGTMQFRYASQIAQDGTASLPVSQAEDYAVVISPVNHTPAAGSAQGQSGASFSDVAPGVWYSAAVAYASQKGLMSGSGNGSFSPEATTTRSQLVSILYRLAGSPAVSGTLPFPDTSADAYYANAVLWATQNNIVGGYANGSFGPSDPVTTEQLCTFLSRYAQLKGLSVSAQAEQLAAFSDRGQVSAYAADPVAWAVSRGIVSGSDSGQLMPKKQTSRAQAAVILMQFCENVL